MAKAAGWRWLTGSLRWYSSQRSWVSFWQPVRHSRSSRARTRLDVLLAISKAFAQLQSKDKTGRLVNLRRKAKCADGLSRETLDASRRDTVNVEVTADWVESAGTLLRASTSKTVLGTVRRRLNSYILGIVLFAGARYLVGHRREVGLAKARQRSNHRATVASRKRIALPNLDKSS